MDTLWCVAKVIFWFSLGVCSVVFLSATYRDYRQRKHQRTYIHVAPDKACAREYVP